MIDVEVKFYTYPEAAKILRCSEKTIFNRVKTGDLRPLRHGRKVLFTEAILAESLQRESEMTPNGQSITCNPDLN